MEWQESLWARARRDTNAALHSRVFLAVDLILSAAIGAALTEIGDSVVERVGVGALGGFVTFVSLIGLWFIVNIPIALAKQRHEARQALSQRDTTSGGISGSPRQQLAEKVREFLREGNQVLDAITNINQPVPKVWGENWFKRGRYFLEDNLTELQVVRWNNARRPKQGFTGMITPDRKQIWDSVKARVELLESIDDELRGSMVETDSQPVGLDKFPQLSEIEKHDLESPTSMLKIMDRRVLKWDLEARRSEVEFGVTIFNGNVYDVLVSPATGNLTYKGQPLEQAILPKQGGPNVLPRGQEYEINLTQYVPDDLAYEVKGEIASGRIRMFGWSGVTVRLRANQPDAPDVRMAIDDGRGFRVGD